MTDSNDTLPSPTAKATPSPKTKEKKTLTALLVLMLILLSAFTIAASIYFWQNLQQQKTVISHLTTQNSSSQQRFQYLEKALGQRLSSLENGRQEQVEQLTKLDRQSLFNTQKLTEMGASSRADWLLAEAEYLLHLANQRLMIENDLKSTESILIAADKVLAEIDDPGLLPVRATINQEILSLQQLTDVDRDGVYMKLAAMITSLDSLNESAFISAKKEQTDKQQSSDDANLKSELTGWQQLWNEVWKDVKQAIVIRRLDGPVAPLLAPEQNYYLKQNLRLMFEQTSLALLEQNEVLFKHSARQASQWINNYFDIQDKQTKSLLSALDELQNISISYEKPDISNSLRQLKTKIEAMYLNHSLGRLSAPKSEGTEPQQQELAP